MPALLPENFFSLIDIRVKNRIQINVHQVFEILFIATGNGIHGLVRIGHGVQKRVQGPFDQFHKGILGRIFPAAAENAVLHDMRRSLAVHGSGAKSDMEYFIFIVVQHHSHPGAGFFMTEKITGGMNIRQLLL